MALILAALLAAFGSLSIDGGLTPSTRVVTLPTAPSWASTVRVRVRHEVTSTFGWETDAFGLGAAWNASAQVRTGWTLRAGGQSIAASRAARVFETGGSATAFDGSIDWDGPSGDSSTTVLDSASDWVFVPVGVPLEIATRAQTAVGIQITATTSNPPSGATVMWLNRHEWSADVDFEFMP